MQTIFTTQTFFCELHTHTDGVSLVLLQDGLIEAGSYEVLLRLNLKGEGGIDGQLEKIRHISKFLFISLNICANLEAGRLLVEESFFF